MKAVTSPYLYISSALIGTGSGPAIPVIQSDNIGIQINFSGATPTGNGYIQASLDQINWVNLQLDVAGVSMDHVPLSTVTSPIYIDIINTSAPFLRFSYVGSPTVTSIQVYITRKRIGD